MPDPTSEPHPFRNADAGTEAKRTHLLRDRRDDLATMPHGIREVYVGRFARIFASGALWVGGLLLLGATQIPSLHDLFGEFVPGTRPAALATLLLATWVVAGFALLLGRSLAEFRFGVAMSKAVLPTEELYGDVDRLQNESPAGVARSMARRLEVVSRLTPVLAFSALVPATALALYSMAFANVAAINELEANLLERSSVLLAIASAGIGLAMLMAFRPNTRLRGFSVVVGISALASFAMSGLASLTALLAALGVTAWIAMRSVRKHQRENNKIEQDGTPLPAVFSIKEAWANALASVRHFASKGKSLIGRHRLVCSSIAALALFAGIAGGSYAAFSPEQGELILQSQTLVDDPLQPSQNHLNDGKLTKTNDLLSFAVRSETDTDHGILIDMNFVQSKEVNATELLDGAKLPSGWSAIVTTTLENGGFPLFIDGLVGAAPRHISSNSPDVTFRYTNCTGSTIPLQLKATPYGEWPKGVTKTTLRYEIQLELTTCPSVRDY